MNKAIIESIEWHKDQLFKLLGDDDLLKMEGSIQSVKTDLNEIIEKAKSKKRIWVKATATKKGHYREQEVGRKEELSDKDRKKIYTAAYEEGYDDYYSGKSKRGSDPKLVSPKNEREKERKRGYNIGWNAADDEEENTG